MWVIKIIWFGFMKYVTSERQVLSHINEKLFKIQIYKVKLYALLDYCGCLF